mmetsp:Transcript_27013/g.72826  ORF Transcript_27013/g.72826 Transcript_27013/m.72826 type:complete len:212 (-) Transcript_27013:35-670(-)
MDYDIPAFDPSSYPWYYAPGLGISLRFSSAQRKLAFAFGAGGRFPIRPHLRNQAAPPEDNAHAVHTHASLRVEHGMAESGPGAGSGTGAHDQGEPPGPHRNTGVSCCGDEPSGVMADRMPLIECLKPPWVRQRPLRPPGPRCRVSSRCTSARCPPRPTPASRRLVLPCRTRCSTAARWRLGSGASFCAARHMAGTQLPRLPGPGRGRAYKL